MAVSTVSDLKRQFLLDNTGLSVGTISDLEYEYYSSLSGLTPKLFYSLADHKRAYFEDQTGLSNNTLAFLERQFWLNDGITSDTMQSMAYDFYLQGGVFNPYSTSASNKLELALDSSSITSTVNQLTNIATNPLALSTGTGWINGNGIYSLLRLTTGIPAHPAGITSAINSSLIAGNVSPNIMSLFAPDGLNATGPARRIGLWVYVNAAGYQYTGAGFTTAPLVANTWTWIKSTSTIAALAYSTLVVSKISGNAPTDVDFVYATGCVTLAGNTAPTTYFAGPTTPIGLTRTNLSTNPRVVGASGWSSNDGASYAATKVSSGVPPHPLGITTAVVCHAVTSNFDPFAASLYDIDSLAAIGPARRVGVWIYSAQSGYEASVASPSPYVPIAAGVWTFVKSTVTIPATTYFGVNVKKTAGNSNSADLIYLTGCLTEAGDTVGDYFDGETTDTSSMNYGWTGAANISSSFETTSMAIDGNPIAQWDDLSGHGRHVTQAVSAKQPLYETNGQNSLPMVKFDGLDDTLYTLASLNFNQPVTIYIVHGYDIASISETSDAVFAVGNGEIALLRGTDITYSWAGGVIEILGTGIAYKVFSTVFNTSSSVLGVNGITSNGNVGSQNPLGPLHISSILNTRNSASNVSAMLIYSEAHSDTKRKRIEKWLGNKYGITVTP